MEIILWEQKNMSSLQDHLVSSGIKIREIVKDDPRTLELKKKRRIFYRTISALAALRPTLVILIFRWTPSFALETNITKP